MLDWISRNHQLLSVVLNVAMLGVWIAYLQLFALSYRRQIRANILINMGGGADLSSRCLVSNMSAGAIYVQSILLEVETADKCLAHSVTETEGLEEWERPSDLNLWTRQGPLQPGEVRDMGAFGVMLDHALRSETGEDQPPPALRDQIRAIKIRIIATYGSENLPVAAERRFAVLRRRDAVRLSPMSAEAHQVRSYARRRRIRELLEADLRQSRHQAGSQK